MKEGLPWRGVHRRSLILTFLTVALGAAFATYFFGPHRNPRDALWRIAHDKCVPDQESNQNPAPCARVDLGEGYVILKDRVGKTQFLLIPTREISGIESPDLLSPQAPNYWAAAWQNRAFVIAASKHDLAWDMIGLAINSASARTQDQLHIHIDCLRPDVARSLAEHGNEIGPTWSELPVDLDGEHYLARRLDASALAADDPFKLLAGGVAEAARDMGQETLVLAGVAYNGSNGFALLARRAEAGHRAHGEDLLDHSCALAKTAPSQSSAR